MSDPWRIRATGDRLDKEAIKCQAPIGEVATRLLGEPRGRGGSRGLWWRCPFHQDANPSFNVDPEKGLFFCHGCGAGGDVFDLVERHENLNCFVQTLDFLAEMFGLDGGPGIAPRRPPAPPKRPEPKPPAVDPAEALALRQTAMRAVQSAVERLWSDEGREALAYWRGRGLSDATIGLARLGFAPSLALPSKDGDRFIRASGSVIPWFDGDRLAKINVRQPDGAKPKYKQPYEDRTTFYAPFEIRPGRPMILVEGEADCLLVGQELRDHANVVTLGSASRRPSREALRAMTDAPRLFIATDADGPGFGTGRELMKRFPLAERVWPTAKDWGDTFKKDPLAIRRIWLPILQGDQAPAEPETTEGEPIEPPAWLVEAIEEAKAERLAIMRADGIEGEPDASMNPAAWLARFNALAGRPNPPELVELQRRGLLDIEPTEGEPEPDGGDEAARLALATEGEPESEADAFEAALVDLFDARRITFEAAPGIQAPAEPTAKPKPWRAALESWSIDRRAAWGELANRLEDQGRPWREAERIAFETIEAESVAVA